MGRAFKLQAVLQHRRYREDSARQRLAEAARALGAARSTLVQREKVHADYSRALRLKQTNGGSPLDIMMYTRYLARLEEGIQDQRQVVEEHVREKEKRRRELMACVKDRKAIEKLKERHLAEMERQERDREQKLLNDVAISRYQRAH